MRWRSIPTALPLIVAGICLSFLPDMNQFPADPEWVLVLVLAPLVFGESLSNSVVDLKRVLSAVALLAIVLVIITAFAVGAAVKLVVPDIGWAILLALGAVVAPTDAVALQESGVLSRLRRRSVDVLEGESLVNDGTALTLLRVAVIAALTGNLTFGLVVQTLALSVLVGLAVGALAGWLLMLLVRHVDEPTVSNALLLISPFPIYFLADTLQGSGILALVVASLLASYEAATVARYRGRLTSIGVWSVVTFALNSTAFFMVGMELPLVWARLDHATAGQVVVAALAAFIVLLVVRFVFAAFLRVAVARGSLREPTWMIVGLAGARGPISILAAFSIPIQVANRDFVLATTLIVVVATLLFTSLVPLLSRRVELASEDDTKTILMVRSELVQAGLDRLAEVEEAEGPIEPEFRSVLVATNRRFMHNVTERMLNKDTEEGSSALRTGSLAIEMMRAEQERLIELRKTDEVPDKIIRPLLSNIDRRIRSLSDDGL